MNYWLDLFTGTTWKELQSAGAKVTGFRQHNWQRASHIRKGDVFLCYLVGVKRWVGLLEVTGDRYKDESPIWGEEVFPVRFPVKPLQMLTPEQGVPMEELRGKLSFYAADDSGGKWSGWVRSSPTKYASEDGAMIAETIRHAAANPEIRAVDERMLKRSSNLYKLKKRIGDEEVEAVVTVPDDAAEEADVNVGFTGASHNEIQWRLLDLGSQMGLSVWAPRSDRGRSWNGQAISAIPRLLESLPTQFDEITNRTIENIDVLWLSKNAIVAAFEVEHSTSIYSGLLRMSDLVTMQPNIDIRLYLVAPDERFSKFRNEVPRPTFAYRNKPLHTVCGFLPYSALCKRLDEVRSVLPYLKPEFIDEIAESVDPVAEFEA